MFLSDLYAYKNIPNLVKSETIVSDVEILYSSGEIHPKFAIKILFYDGGSMEIHGINKKGEGDLNIFKIDDYIIIFNEKYSKRPAGQEIAMGIFSIIADEQLETIIDIIRNYHKISNFINNLPDEYDENFMHHFHFLINGHEYFLSKSKNL